MAPPPLPLLLSLLLLLLLLLFSPPFLNPMVSSSISDVNLLLQIKSTLSNGLSLPDSLSSWTNSTPLCSWSNIQWTFTTNSTLLDCSSPSLLQNPNLASDPTVAAFSISLPSAGLVGSIPSSLSSLPWLRTLDLSGNNLTGGIPVALGQSPSLASIKLGSNQLSGAIPASLWRLCSDTNSDKNTLEELSLDHNQFSGSIPAPASSVAACPQLRKLDFSYNLLSGSIPGFLGTFAPGLTDLDLSNNSLTGQIPGSLAKLANLTGFDVSNNNLSGQIPELKSSVGAGAYAGNSLLCGAPLEGQVCVEISGGHLNKRVVAALVIGAMAVAVVGLAICVALGHHHNWGRDAMRAGFMKRELIDGANGEDDVGDGKLIRFEGGEHLNVEEVLNAPGEVLGKTTYGTVYKAKLGGGGSNGGGGMIALRLLREETVKEKDEFTLGIRQIGQVRYPNVVSLLAYYAGPKGEKLLVYNYLSRGSLADLLYSNRSMSRTPLSWARRHKIALGAARGLAHLHHGVHPQVIHGNLKSKNIIVDESFEGHLADYGLSLVMNLGAQSEMLKSAASQGYKAPELIKMSRANPKTDVYNFGIILLEILTGKKPREPAEGSGSDKLNLDLPVYVKQAILEERASDLFDLEILSGVRNAVDEGLVQTLQLAMGCCAPSPMVRPDIKEVVRRLEEIRPKLPTPLYTPMGMKSPRDFVV